MDLPDFAPKPEYVASSVSEDVEGIAADVVAVKFDVMSQLTDIVVTPSLKIEA